MQRQILCGLILLSLGGLLYGCGNQSSPVAETTSTKKLADEPTIPDVSPPKKSADKGDDFYHFGAEDHSERCKPIPALESLNSPKIVISTEGLYLHLWDRAGEYDKVFPIGVGRVSNDGDSLTPDSLSQEEQLFYIRGASHPAKDTSDVSERRWAWLHSCRIWSGSKYYNDMTNQQEFRSYFAGLPFLRLEGSPRAAYGIHGPITSYWQEDGGDLKRGYVSSGCVRMESKQVREVYAKIKGNRTPVRVQKEPEIRDDGLPVNPDRFINAQCNEDADCADDGAICVRNPRTLGGFCTKPCTHSAQCPDRASDGNISTPSREAKCVKNPLNDTTLSEPVYSQGICLTESSPTANKSCNRFDGRFESVKLPRAGWPIEEVEVCAPTRED